MDLNLKHFLYFNTENIDDKLKSLEEFIHTYDLVNIIDTIESAKNCSSKNVLSVLARCCCIRNDNVFIKNKCYNIANTLCQTSENLFFFICIYNKIHRKLYNASGWTNYLKSFLSNWYNNQSLDKLIYNITECSRKYGWEHKDLIRLSHIKAKNEEYNIVFKYILRGKGVLRNVEWDSSLRNLLAYECMKYEKNEFNIIEYIHQFKFNYKQIPPYFLRFKIVWDELLKTMTITDILDNINHLHDVNLFNDDTNLTIIKHKMENSSISPLKYFYAFKNYVNYTLYTNNQLTHELMLQFYKSFNKLKGLDVKTCIGLNINRNYPILYSNVYSYELSCALGMMFDFIENDCDIVGFKNNKMISMNITAASCLEENMENINLNSSTNCDEIFKRNDDVIILITDKAVNLEQLNKKSKYIIIDLSGKINGPNIPNLLVLKSIDENVYNNIINFCSVF